MFVQRHSHIGPRKLDGRRVIIESWMELDPRKMYFCDCWSLSADGRTLIMEHRDDALAGQRVVLEKAPVARASI